MSMMDIARQEREYERDLELGEKKLRRRERQRKQRFQNRALERERIADQYGDEAADYY